jgi:hypothetical protein
MKKLLIITLFFVATKVISQKDSTKTFAISIEGNYSKTLGDNFLRNAYKPYVGYALEAQVNTKKILFGIGYKNNNYQVTNQNIVGDFQTAYLSVNYLFGGYRNYIKNKKLYLEHRLGFGMNTLKNYSILSKYKITGKSAFIGSKINYNFNPKLNFYLGLEFNSSKYDVSVDEPFKDFYTKACQIEPKIGIKFLMGTKTK